jgi:hypothetical protein
MRCIAAVAFSLAFGGACLAQQWELGAGAGMGFHKNLTVSNSSGSADAGFKPGPAFSVFAAQDMYQHLGGAFRYTFQMSDLKLSSGGVEESFGARSHAIEYDVVFYGGGREANVRPFLSAGGGVKIYEGSGKEQLSQPLENYALLTKTRELKPLISAGGGVKVRVGRGKFLYLEARDYITPPPQQVLAPNTITGSKLSGGWVHDFVPMLSLSFSF